MGARMNDFRSTMFPGLDPVVVVRAGMLMFLMHECWVLLARKYFSVC